LNYRSVQHEERQSVGIRHGMTQSVFIKSVSSPISLTTYRDKSADRLQGLLRDCCMWILKRHRSNHRTIVLGGFLSSAPQTPSALHYLQFRFPDGI